MAFPPNVNSAPKDFVVFPRSKLPAAARLDDHNPSVNRLSIEVMNDKERLGHLA